MPSPTPSGFKRTDIWREGKWLDLWSVVHFLSGISLGLGLSIFNFGTVPTLFIGFLLLVGYELWEAMVQIHETPQNRFMDVIVGMASFVPAFFVSIRLPFLYFALTFLFVMTTNIVLATMGWYESRKAAELQERMRARFLLRRKLFLERRERWRAVKVARHARKVE